MAEQNETREQLEARATQLGVENVAELDDEQLRQEVERRQAKQANQLEDESDSEDAER